MLHLTAITEIPESITHRKVIVYKSRVDPASLKQKAEEMKNELFLKRFSKPKPEDIHVVSVDKHYEPYVLVDAKYRIEYFTKKTFTFDVTEKAKVVKILGKTLKPKMLPIPNTDPEQFRKVINLEGHEWSSFEEKAYFILNKKGDEITPDQVPIAPSEDNPRKILKEFAKNAEKLKMSNREVLELAKSKTIQRPKDVDDVDKEIFQITEYALIYNPIYKITFRNEKTKEEKTVSIDGVSAEVIN